MHELTGKSLSAIRAYERGVNEPPGSVLQIWSKATNKSPEWLLGQADTSEVDKGVVVQMNEVTHPGVEQLAQDDDLRREERISDQEITELRQLRGKWANGQPIIIQTRAQALDWLRTLRASRPFSL